MSMKFTPAASILTNACPSVGVGRGSSSSRIASTPPGAWTRTALITSAIYRAHSPFGVTGAGRDALGRDGVDAAQILARELHRGRRDVLFDVAPALGTGDRDELGTLRQ